MDRSREGTSRFYTHGWHLDEAIATGTPLMWGGGDYRRWSVHAVIIGLNHWSEKYDESDRLELISI